ncbi:sigma factor [Curtobacterium flaccumfaciens]|nr:sigma factor [Curtobacterium flaccumfaciens]
MAQGDTGALARAFDRYAATLTRYAWALVDDRSDVEEIVQDAFLTLWQRAATLELPADTVLPWLLVVCRNHAFNTGRKQARRRADELPRAPHLARRARRGPRDPPLGPGRDRRAPRPRSPHLRALPARGALVRRGR